MTSCTGNIKEKGTKYSVKIDEILDSIPFDSIVDSYKLIKLETLPNCLIGDVKQMLFDDELIYIVSEGLYCFDMKGKFIYAINQKGRGPG